MSEKETAVAVISDLRSALEKAEPKLAEVAMKHINAGRLIRLILSACSRNPKLLECSKESVLQFCMKCSETGLEPIGPGGAWPVPHRNNKTGKTDMQFIPDYRGLINCAKRADAIRDAWSEVVREQDEFDLVLGMNPDLKHKPARGERGKLQGAYCIVTLPDGSKRPVYMDAEEIGGIRGRSRAGTSGPWVTDEAQMWCKTVVRRAMKPFAGMSPALDAALDADDTATGVVDREPIRQPKAIAEAAAPAAAAEPPPPADNADQAAIEAQEREALVTQLAKIRAKSVQRFEQTCKASNVDPAKWRELPAESLRELLTACG